MIIPTKQGFHLIVRGGGGPKVTVGVGDGKRRSAEVVGETGKLL